MRMGDTECKNGHPEVDKVRCPEREPDMEEHQQCAHANVYAGTSKTQEEKAE